MDTTSLNVIDSLVLESPDPAATEAFHAAAFGLGDRLAFRASDAATSGFRGFTISLVVSQPGTVDSLVGTALAAGATEIKAPAKSFWGYGAAVQTPDGTVWTIASSAKKDAGPATREIDGIVLLLGVENVKATKQFYVDRGLVVGRSFGSKYVEFDTAGSPITLALQSRKAVAKNAGVDPAGTGSHRLAVRGGAGSFTDPDGFVWEQS